MALKEEEYQELFQSIRKTMQGSGLSSIDEQIMSRFKGSEGHFYDLAMYLRLLVEYMSLSSDFQFRTDLQRIQEVAETESGHPIEGVRLQLSPEEAKLYKIETINLMPIAANQKIVEELHSVLDELDSDWEDRDSEGKV